MLGCPASVPTENTGSSQGSSLWRWPVVLVLKGITNKLNILFSLGRETQLYIEERVKNVCQLLASLHWRWPGLQISGAYSHTPLPSGKLRWNQFLLWAASFWLSEVDQLYKSPPQSENEGGGWGKVKVAYSELSLLFFLNGRNFCLCGVGIYFGAGLF